MAIVTAMVAVAAVSAVMQAYQAEKARGASAAELDRIEKLFDSIVPPNFDVRVYDDPKLAADIPPAALNTERIDPELFKSVGQFIPEVAQFVEETSPELVQASGAAKQGRQAQLDALERYKQIASGEFDPQLAQKLSSASQIARRDAQGQRDAIQQDSQRKGRLGSGIDIASQLSASGDAMTRESQAGQLAAAESYRNQLSALSNSANLGGNIRNSEMNEEARNVGIINDFNERTSRNYQQYLTSRSDASNQAQRYNLGRDQSIADANTKANNAANIDQRNMYNDAAVKRQQSARDNQNRRIDIQQQKDKLKQQMYDNLLEKARGKSGLASARVDNINQSAADRNRAVAGVSNAAQAGILYNDKHDKPDKYSYNDDDYQKYRTS